MEWAEYTKMIVEKCKRLGTPASATFELTPFCNFNCNMCYIHLSPEQAKAQGSLLTTEQWLRIAHEAKSLGTVGLEITGGEAVTRPDFSALYEAFIKMGYLISLRTNGYLLRGKLFELLKKYKPRCVSVTLYGGSDETYRKVCGISDGFSVVTRNIFAMREAGINLRLTMTMTKDNIKDCDILKNWAKNNGLFITFFGGLITPIRSAKRSIDHLKVDFDRNLSNTGIEPSFRIICDREKYMKPFWMCKGYGAKFCISWDGRMTLCNCLPSIWTDSLSQSIGDAYKSLYEELNNVSRPAECINCQYIDYCGACPVRFLSETGSHDKTIPDICRKAKTHYEISMIADKKSADSNKEELSLSFIERNALNED